ncbi:hypothetical protein Asp14428_42680 [Actinoplanes sp. NBRC 14428]|uniref:Uncharacterized protein DUF397 n=1 Tax=Pseudosporangium ferrugineum TaxID=439699 RepID=A0A2T0S7U5_9ACTN|nr:DUF397 domain-containing protein [Pseudosporangium ferrugineum]PRY29465.1 uncharacterized protein DUF397 [Pseudosporangium ferrugineum]BCJ52793.1 hypothetical protein Asp14428_42680 [Actinoplanes sp. NBRC 14428]
MNPTQTAQWRKSSRCGTNACVEVAQFPDRVMVRDSKDLSVAPLTFTRDEWTAFVHGVKRNEFGGE